MSFRKNESGSLRQITADRISEQTLVDMFTRERGILDDINFAMNERAGNKFNRVDIDGRPYRVDVYDMGAGLDVVKIDFRSNLLGKVTITLGTNHEIVDNIGILDEISRIIQKKLY